MDWRWLNGNIYTKVPLFLIPIWFTYYQISGNAQAILSSSRGHIHSESKQNWLFKAGKHINKGSLNLPLFFPVNIYATCVTMWLLPRKPYYISHKHFSRSHFSDRWGAQSVKRLTLSSAQVLISKLWVQASQRALQWAWSLLEKKKSLFSVNP